MATAVTREGPLSFAEFRKRNNLESGMLDGIARKLYDKYTAQVESKKRDHAKDAILDDILETAKADKDKATGRIDSVLGPGVEHLQGLNTYVGAGNEKAVGDFDALIAGLDPVNYGSYVGDLSSEAARAKADTRSRAAQYDALDKLKGMSTTEVTPAERFMMLQARMEQERDQRAAREATLSDLSARGVRSGSAEMAAMLGAQRQTSQNRLLENLGAEKNAIERALTASQAYGQLGTDISEQTFGERFKTGEAADQVAQFNNELKSDYQRERARFDLDQQDAIVGRGEKSSRLKLDSNRDAWDRGKGVADYELDGTVSAAQIQGGTSQGIADALKLKLGKLSEEDAYAELKGV